MSPGTDALDRAVTDLYAGVRPGLLDAVGTLLARGLDPGACQRAALQAGASPEVAADVRRIARHLLRRRHPACGGPRPPRSLRP